MMQDSPARDVNVADQFADKDGDDEYMSKYSMSYRENSSLPMRQKWMANVDEDNFQILDPDDPLMKRFQDALKSHLSRIDNRLSEEIHELVSIT